MLKKAAQNYRLGGNRFGLLIPATREQGEDWTMGIRKLIEDMRWADATSLELSVRIG